MHIDLHINHIGSNVFMFLFLSILSIERNAGHPFDDIDDDMDEAMAPEPGALAGLQVVAQEPTS